MKKFPRPADSPSRTNRPVRRIGFFAPSESEYAQRLVEGMLQFQADRGGCIIRDFRFDAEDPEDKSSWAVRPHPWKDWTPDGLIVHIAPDPGLAEWIKTGGCPVVNTTCLLRTSSESEFPAVYVSGEAIDRQAVSYFHSMGFVHFAYVTGVAMDRRIERLQSILRTNSTALEIGLLQQNPSHWDGHKEAELAADPELRRVLLNSPKPLAIMTINDDVGRVVCLAAQQLGLSIPHQVAVLGVNDTLASRTSLPPLSSIRTPGDEVGYQAMEMLWQIMEGHRVHDCVEIPPGKLIVRESTSVANDGEADIVRARQIIRDRACEGVHISQIIAELNVSRSTLQRDFHEAFGHGPGEELSLIRIARAKELLRTTHLPILRIAQMVGYGRPSSFNAFFLRHTGMTPRAFRAGKMTETR